MGIKRIPLSLIYKGDLFLEIFNQYLQNNKKQISALRSSPLFLVISSFSNGVIKSNTFDRTKLTFYNETKVAPTTYE